jgi:hypothetical protein
MRYFNKTTKTEVIKGVHTFDDDCIELDDNNVFWSPTPVGYAITYVNGVPTTLDVISDLPDVVDEGITAQHINNDRDIKSAFVTVEHLNLSWSFTVESRTAFAHESQFAEEGDVILWEADDSDVFSTLSIEDATIIAKKVRDELRRLFTEAQQLKKEL